VKNMMISNVNKESDNDIVSFLIDGSGANAHMCGMYQHVCGCVNGLGG